MVPSSQFKPGALYVLDWYTSVYNRPGLLATAQYGHVRPRDMFVGLCLAGPGTDVRHYAPGTNDECYDLKILTSDGRVGWVYVRANSISRASERLSVASE